MPLCERCGRYAHRLHLRRIRVGRDLKGGRSDRYVASWICRRCLRDSPTLPLPFFASVAAGLVVGVGFWAVFLFPTLLIIKASPLSYLVALLASILGGQLLAHGVARWPRPPVAPAK
jgi:hypothetical protein